MKKQIQPSRLALTTLLLALVGSGLVASPAANAQTPARPAPPQKAEVSLEEKKAYAKMLSETLGGSVGKIKSPPPSPEVQARWNRLCELSKQGNSFYNAGNYPEALKVYEEGMRLDHPGWFFNYDRLGNIYEMQGRWADALKLYEQRGDNCLASGVSDSRLLMDYALILLKNGQKAKAVQAYHAALPGLATNTNAHPVPLKRFVQAPASVSDKWLEAAIETGRAMTNLFFDQTVAARQLRRALMLYPSFAPANYYLGSLLRNNPDPALQSEGQAALQRAMTSGTPQVQAATDKLLKR